MVIEFFIGDSDTVFWDHVCNFTGRKLRMVFRMESEHYGFLRFWHGVVVMGGTD
jgi:hypothetical protein